MELDVALTDFFLTGLCAALGWRVPPTSPAPLRSVYSALAVASAIGGVFHLLPHGSPLRPHLWWCTLVAVGVVAAATYRCAWVVAWGRSRRAVDVALAGLLALYAVAVTFFSRDFLLAIVGYLPAVLALAAASLLAFRRSRDRRWLIGLAGVALTLLAAGIQQEKWGIHPVYLSPNSLYHLVQAVGLMLLFPVCRARREELA